METKNKIKPQIGEARARKRTSFWLEIAIVGVERAGRVVAKMSKVTEINKRNVRRFINLQSGETLNSLNKNNHDNFSNFSEVTK